MAVLDDFLDSNQDWSQCHGEEWLLKRPSVNPNDGLSQGIDGDAGLVLYNVVMAIVVTTS